MRALLPDVTSPGSYFFWLVLISGAVFLLERLRPWRVSQHWPRPQLAQDLFWLVFNGHFAGALIALGVAHGIRWLAPAFASAESVGIVAARPIWLQFVVAFLLKDLLDYGVHNLLHRVPFLWRFHKVHHSIERMDWIGNFRFHWMEIVVYRGLTYFPLAVLGVDGGVLLAIAVVSTTIGHLNHSNLDITWGPLRYVFNSPRMHIWHHDREWPADRRRGLNFGISLSAWDWIFGTAWWPSRAESPTQQPARLGFDGLETYPRSLFDRILYPISKLWNRR